MRETHLALRLVEGQEALGQEVIFGLSPGGGRFFSVVGHFENAQM